MVFNRMTLYTLFYHHSSRKSCLWRTLIQVVSGLQRYKTDMQYNINCHNSCGRISNDY